MKKSTLLFLFISIVSFTSQTQAIPVIYHNGETYNIVEELPSGCIIEGNHVNLAVKYNQFGLFWLPVWNYGTPEYILLTDDETGYWDANQESMEQLRTEFHITSIPKEASPSLWNKIGLKPLIILFIAYLTYAVITEKKEEKSTEEKIKNKDLD